MTFHSGATSIPTVIVPVTSQVGSALNSPSSPMRIVDGRSETPSYLKNKSFKSSRPTSTLGESKRREKEQEEMREQLQISVMKEVLKCHPNFRMRLCLVGAKASGKTSLIKSYLHYRTLRKQLEESQNEHGEKDMPNLSSSQRSLSASSFTNKNSQVGVLPLDVARPKSFMYAALGGTADDKNQLNRNRKYSEDPALGASGSFVTPRVVAK